jgi:carboxymethylenebutenolidase
MSGCATTLRAHDGHELAAYAARGEASPRGGIVLLQEIFGVTAHIRRVCDGYAREGYHVIAPALFDRVERGLELDYSKEDAARGRALRARIPWQQTLADVVAAFEHLAGSGKVAAIGYCWGGTVAWRSAAHLDGLAAAVCYYPTLIAPYVAETPRCPVLMHFGEQDPIATRADAEALRQAQGSAVEIQFYPASHGFNCDEIAGFDRPSADLALRRTLDWLRQHVG